MWTPTTRRQHSRNELRNGSDLTDAGWEIVAPLVPHRRWPMHGITVMAWTPPPASRWAILGGVYHSSGRRRPCRELQQLVWI